MHVEAGLRSNIVNMPEEQNRVFADYLSDYLICPNKEAYKNIRFIKIKKFLILEMLCMIHFFITKD